MQIYILQTFTFGAWPRGWNRVVGKLGFNPLLANILLYRIITLVMSLFLYISDKLTILHGQSDHLSRRFRSLISERDSR